MIPQTSYVPYILESHKIMLGEPIEIASSETCRCYNETEIDRQTLLLMLRYQ